MRTIVLLLLLAVCFSLKAQSIATDEVGDFLKKACMFVNWPEEFAKQKNFRIGIIATPEDVGKLSRYFQNTELKSKPVSVIEFSSFDDISNFHTLIIMKKLSEIQVSKLKQGRNLPVLIISTVQQSAVEPCQIFLERKNNKVVFIISESGVKNSGLQVSYILFSEAEVIDKLNY